MPFFEGYKFCGFRNFLKIRKNYFRKNEILTVQDGRRHKFVRIKSAKMILRQIREVYSPQKKAPYGISLHGIIAIILYHDFRSASQSQEKLSDWSNAPVESTSRYAISIKIKQYLHYFLVLQHSHLSS